MLKIPQKKDAIKNINSNHLLIPLNNYLEYMIEATRLNIHVPIMLYEASCFLNTCLVSLAVPAIRFVDIHTL